MTTSRTVESSHEQISKYMQQHKTLQEQDYFSGSEAIEKEKLGPTRYGDWEVDGRCTDF